MNSKNYTLDTNTNTSTTKNQLCNNTNKLSFNYSNGGASVVEHKHNKRNDKITSPAKRQHSGTYFHRLLEPFSSQPTDTHDSTTPQLEAHTEDSSLASFNLNRILKNYGDRPELLQLILSSKLEEDRRKSEEAKLKQRELDFLLSDKEEQSDKEYQTEYIKKDCLNMDEIPADSQIKNCYKSREKQCPTIDNFQRRRSSSTASNPPPSNNEIIIPSPFDYNLKRRRDEEAFLFSPQRISNKEGDYFLPTFYHDKRHKSLNLLSNNSPGVGSSPTHQLQSFKFLNARRNSFGQFSPSSLYGTSKQSNTLPPISPPALLPDTQQIAPSFNSSSYHSPSITNTTLSQQQRLKKLPTLDSFEASIMETLYLDDSNNYSSSDTKSDPKKQGKKLCSPHKSKNTQQQTSTAMKSSSSESTALKKLPIPPEKPSSFSSQDKSNRPRRRRREMQAITMIIETREFPYHDEYVWKNNGNTVHKSSGQKSIYYKCSNSNEGCPVNKTVTFKENGEYLIKYRGSHFVDCSKIKRILNVQQII